MTDRQPSRPTNDCCVFACRVGNHDYPKGSCDLERGNRKSPLGKRNSPTRNYRFEPGTCDSLVGNHGIEPGTCNYPVGNYRFGTGNCNFGLGNRGSLVGTYELQMGICMFEEEDYAAAGLSHHSEVDPTRPAILVDCRALPLNVTEP